MGEETITFSVPGVAEKMSATLNRGAKDSHFGIILAHGAGGNSRSGHLPQIVEAFTKAGFWCLRFDCKPPILKKRVERFEALLNHAREQHAKGKYPVKKWIMSGHSMASSSEAPEATVEQYLF
ncbi:hypothetical protein WJX75_005087 [Coccomyxa subellipsoidea]|uniref:Serine aminopeptidase S33 domain-containing protein n=1 Tax=Coccomyxa subellipsoidea TaxID=248742 RepID=A0ABR2Z0S3_9CHLO